MVYCLVLATLLGACHAISLLLDRDQIDLDAGGACRDAAPGEWCHAAVAWAKEIGHVEHPEWFPGDATQYSEGDFQALLHQHGEVQCSRPCAQTSVSLLETADSAAVRRAAANADETFGLRQAEFMAVMENIWAPKAMTGDAPVTRELSKTDCQEAQAGSMCFHAVEWLRKSGIAKHPTWYPSLTPRSSPKDVQALLHTLHKADCAQPCEEVRAELASRDDEVVEIDDHGRQVKSQAFELDEPSCGTTKPGEWCYQSIQWLKNAGLRKHPDWYPKLSTQSSIEDFQTVLHKQGKVGCLLPCKEGETATVKIHNSECQDAQEGSLCHKGIMHIIEVGLWVHPELYPELNTNSTRQEVQDHLYRHGQSQCGWPCSMYKQGQRVEEVPPHAGLVKKRLQDMSVKELAWYLNKQWDGYVSDKVYDPNEAVKGDHEPPANESAEDPLPAVTSADRVEEGQGYVARIDGEKTCRTAKVGELCFKAVSWAKLTGVVDHPSWYLGLSTESSFKEFQAYIHKTRGSLCDAPCAADLEPAAEDVAASNREATTVAEAETTSAAPDSKSGGSEGEDATAAVEETTSAAPGAGPTGGDVVEAGKGEEATAAVEETTSAAPGPGPTGGDMVEAGKGEEATAAVEKTTSALDPGTAGGDVAEATPDEGKVLETTSAAALPVDSDSQVAENGTEAAPPSPVALPRNGWAAEEENASSQLVASNASMNVVYEELLPYVDADARHTSIEEEAAAQRQQEANSTAEDPGAPAQEVDVTAVEVSEEEAKPTAVDQAATEEAVKRDVAVEATQEAAQDAKEEEADEARQEAAQKAQDELETEQAAAFGGVASEEAALEGKEAEENASSQFVASNASMNEVYEEQANSSDDQADAVEAVKRDVAIEATQEAAQVAKEEEADEKRQEAAEAALGATGAAVVARAEEEDPHMSGPLRALRKWFR